MQFEFSSFFAYGMMLIFAPRLAFAVLLLMNAGDNVWAYTLCVICLMHVAEDRIKQKLRRAADATFRFLTGRQFVVERIVEKVVEKTVDKVVERKVYVEKPIAVYVPRDMTVQDAYACLGVAPGADSAVLKSAFRARVKMLHPDNGGSEYLAHIVISAYKMLTGKK